MIEREKVPVMIEIDTWQTQARKAAVPSTWCLLFDDSLLTYGAGLVVKKANT